jgi:hypothetical protein
MIKFSQLNARINPEKNLVVTESPIETFLGAPCTLLGQIPASAYEVEHVENLFVHEFNPSEFKEGKKIPYTDLEYITHSKHTNDLSDKSWSALAFNRAENKIVSGKGWSVWASDRHVEDRWLKQLQNEYSNVPMMDS